VVGLVAVIASHCQVGTSMLYTDARVGRSRLRKVCRILQPSIYRLHRQGLSTTGLRVYFFSGY
jgi:hypothetical protein